MKLFSATTKISYILVRHFNCSVLNTWSYNNNNNNNNKLFIRTYQYGLIEHIGYKS